LVLKTVTVSTLPSLERHPAPVEFAMTVEAVFVKPAQGLQSPAAGNVKPFPMKLVPPLPKPPFTLMQKFAEAQTGASRPRSRHRKGVLKRRM
jgi:hypothetical protein